MPTRRAIIEKSITKDKDLSDQQTQAEILHPGPREVLIGGKPLHLYPLSGFQVRALTGFAAGIFLESGTADDLKAFSIRVMPVITRPQNAMQVISFLVSATFPSPKDAEAAKKAQIERIFRELNDATAGPKGAYELALAFVTLCEQNDVQDVAEAMLGDDDEDDTKK